MFRISPPRSAVVVETGFGSSMFLMATPRFSAAERAPTHMMSSFTLSRVAGCLGMEWKEIAGQTIITVERCIALVWCVERSYIHSP